MDDGVFFGINAQTIVVTPPAESLLLFENLENGKQCIKLKQSMSRQCCILFAIRDKKGIWRLRYRAVVTKNGLIIFLVHKTLPFENNRFVLPPEIRMNRIAVIGFDAKQEPFYTKIKVCYVEFVGVDLSGRCDEVIGNALSSEEKKHTCFMRYCTNARQPLGTFRQRNQFPAISR